MTRSRSVRSMENTLTNRNGGYITYWSLIFKQGPQMIASLGPQLKKQYDEKIKVALTPGQRVLVRFAIVYLAVMMTVLILVKLPWWLLIKPLGAVLYHTVKKYKVMVNDNRIVQYKRSLTVYLFRFIPLYLGTSKKPKEKDLKYLFKDEAANMVFAPEPKAMFI